MFYSIRKYCWNCFKYTIAFFFVLVGGAVLEDGDGTDLAQVYSPKTTVWTDITPMQIARSGSAACTLKGKIYVIGMIFLQIVFSVFNILQIQFPGLYKDVIFFFWLFILKSLLTGGWHASTENTDKVECYNPNTNQWTMCAPMKERRYRPGAAVVDGKIYVLGGEEGWDRWVLQKCNKNNVNYNSRIIHNYS